MNLFTNKRLVKLSIGMTRRMRGLPFFVRQTGQPNIRQRRIVIPGSVRQGEMCLGHRVVGFSSPSCQSMSRPPEL